MPGLRTPNTLNCCLVPCTPNVWLLLQILVCYNQELHLVPCTKRGTCPRDQPLLYLKTQGHGVDPRVVLGSVTLLCVFAVGMLAFLMRLI